MEKFKLSYRNAAGSEFLNLEPLLRNECKKLGFAWCTYTLRWKRDEKLEIFL